jgi:hypothetical protein
MTRNAWVVAALCALAPVGAAAAPLCVVSGKEVQSFIVDLAPKGSTPFKLRVFGVAARVRPAEDDAPAEVEVKGALEFTARAATWAVPYTLKKRTDAASGLVRVAPATSGFHARNKGRWVDADLRLGEVELHGLHFRCDDLTLDAVPNPPHKGGEPHGQPFMAKESKLTVHHAPGEGPTVDVVLGDRRSQLEVHRLHAQGKWWQVTAQWPTGTLLVGWVEADKLEPLPAGKHELSDFTPRPPCNDELAPRAGTTLAEATVQAGTPVFAERLVGEWAVVRKPLQATVRHKPGEEWVELVKVPGVASAATCPFSATMLDHAWVRRGQVTFADAPPAPPAETPAPAAE